MPGKPIGEHSLTNDWAPRSITRLYGQRLREGRERAGLTQAQAAEAAGVSQASVTRWERGEVQPDVRALMALAKAYGCRVSEIMPRNQYPLAPLDPVARQEFFWRRNGLIQGWDPDEYVEVMREQLARVRGNTVASRKSDA